MNDLSQNELNIDHLLSLFEQACSEQRGWLEIWQMFLQHPAFLAIARRAAEFVVAHYQLPVSWTEDVQQEAYFYFARLVQKDRDLRFDPSKASISAWLATLMFGCCRKATRQFRDAQRQKVEIIESDRAENPFETLDLLIDLLQKINELDDPVRLVVFMHWQGESIAEIARQISRSERTVYRLLEQGVEVLESLLKD